MILHCLDSPPLRTFTGRGVTIAIVDSGVQAEHPHVNGIAGGMHLTPDGEDTDFGDRIGHGTAVAAAIREKAPDARLIAIRVFDRSLSTSGELLARAIARAAGPEVGARLINLSLGTRNEAHLGILRGAVALAAAAGALVVAAAPDGDDKWFPGAIDGTLGVRLDWTLDRHCVRFERPPGGTLQLVASGFPRPIPGVPPERNLKGVSFAVANATGILARVAEANAGARTPEEFALAIAGR